MEAEGNDAVERARAVVGGADISIAELRDRARALRNVGQTALVGELLTAVSRRALYDGWRTLEHADLAMKVLRDHQQFGYARRLLRACDARGRTRSDCVSSMRCARTRISNCPQPAVSTRR